MVVATLPATIPLANVLATLGTFCSASYHNNIIVKVILSILQAFLTASPQFFLSSLPFYPSTFPVPCKSKIRLHYTRDRGILQVHSLCTNPNFLKINESILSIPLCSLFIRTLMPSSFKITFNDRSTPEYFTGAISLDKLPSDLKPNSVRWFCSCIRILTTSKGATTNLKNITEE